MGLHTAVLVLVVGRCRASCCWLEQTALRVGPNSRGEGLALAPAVCRDAASAACFVSCLVMRPISVGAACACPAARRRAEVGAASAPHGRRLSKTNVYSGAWLAPRGVVARRQRRKGRNFF